MNKCKVYAALAACVTYNQDTGIITWKYREELSPSDKMFNTRFAGRECGRPDIRGYMRIKFTHERKSYMIFSHRVAWLIAHGRIPDGDIDHINRNPADNRIENLRDVSKAINHRNQTMSCNNKSGVTGVTWHKAYEKWRTYASINGRQHHLGYFTCIHEATSAVKDFRAKHGFTASHGESMPCGKPALT